MPHCCRDRRCKSAPAPHSCYDKCGNAVTKAADSLIRAFLYMSPRSVLFSSSIYYFPTKISSRSFVSVYKAAARFEDLEYTGKEDNVYVARLPRTFLPTHQTTYESQKFCSPLPKLMPYNIHDTPKGGVSTTTTVGNHEQSCWTYRQQHSFRSTMHPVPSVSEPTSGEHGGYDSSSAEQR